MAPKQGQWCTCWRAGGHSEGPQEAKKKGWPLSMSAKAKCKILHLSWSNHMHQDWLGDWLPGKQLGIKWCGGPGGQAEFEQVMYPCQEGQLQSGCQNQSSQQTKGNGYSFLSSTCETASGKDFLVLGFPAQGQLAHTGTSPAKSWMVLHNVTLLKMKG